MSTDVWYYWGEDWRMHVGRAPLPFISPPYRCGTLTHDNVDIDPRQFSLRFGRVTKGRVDND